MTPSDHDWPTTPPPHRPLRSTDPSTVGPYRLEAVLGAGGMGRVYLGRTPAGSAVAVKVVHREYAEDRSFRKRFEQEAATARTVQGLYTVPVVDADIDAPEPWLATAYVPGPSLQDAVADHGPLSAAAVLRLVAGVAEALQSIHAAGVIHRDLKPSNVILTAEGPKVIDFGIARAVNLTSITGTGVMPGTPAYMAPEQILGHVVTPAADVFALGILTNFAATGALAFGGESLPAVIHGILQREPELDGCPEPLAGIAAACLDKEPERRPTPAEIVRLCSQTATDGAASPTPRAEPTPPAPTKTDAPQPTASPTPPAAPAPRAEPTPPAPTESDTPHPAGSPTPQAVPTPPAPTKTDAPQPTASPTPPAPTASDTPQPTAAAPTPPPVPAPAAAGGPSFPQPFPQPFPPQYPQPYPTYARPPSAGVAITALILCTASSLCLVWSAIAMIAGYPTVSADLPPGGVLLVDVVWTIGDLLLIIGTILMWGRTPVGRILAIIGLIMVLAAMITCELVALLAPYRGHVAPLMYLINVLTVPSLAFVLLSDTERYLKAGRPSPYATPYPPGP